LGECPEARRAVRVEGGWAEEGSLVEFYADITPPMPWERTGVCWAGRSHPVVPVRRIATGAWVADLCYRCMRPRPFCVCP
jgi:hypothetical protein